MKIKRDNQTKKNQPLKLLLLGTGESGKSTIFSQMKIIHRGGITEEERITMRVVVMDNLLQCICFLVNGAKKLGIDLDNDEHKAMAEKVLDVQSKIEEENLSIEEHLPGIVKDIKELWKDAGMRKAFEKRNQFQIYDQAQYFLDQPDRFVAPDFIPADEDIIKCRGKTLGVTSLNFDLENKSFSILDIGGQRSERKKWADCFQDTTAIIFVTSLSEYDQTLFEDSMTNRMEESLKMFDEVCNSKYFKDSHIILFLNKTDLFKEKIKKYDPKNFCFPEYTGGLDHDKACDYIEQAFKKRIVDHKLYIHKTCATDTGNIKYVFSVVKDIIFSDLLNQIM